MRNCYSAVLFSCALVSCALISSASSQQSSPGQSSPSQPNPSQSNPGAPAQSSSSLPQSSSVPQAKTPDQQSGEPRADKSENKSADKTADLAQAAEKSPTYSQESFVVEKMQTRYRFETDGTGRKEVIARIRVQSEAGVQQWGQLQFGYNSANERVEIPYVRVLKEDGSVVKAGDEAVQDLSAPVEHEAPV